MNITAEVLFSVFKLINKQLTIISCFANLIYRSTRPLSSGQTSNRPLKGEIVTVLPTGKIGRPLVRPPSIHFYGKRNIFKVTPVQYDYNAIL